jgi:hypothetical protein
MTMTSYALSSSLDISAKSRPTGSFLHRFIGALIEGRQHKADLEVAEYLGRHPEYRDLNDEVQRPLRGR